MLILLGFFNIYIDKVLFKYRSSLMSLKTSNNLEKNIVCLKNFSKLYLLLCRAKNGNFSLTGSEAVCN